MSRKLFFRAILLIVIIGAAYRFFTHQPKYSMTHVTGQTMGTIQYNVKYMGNDVPDYKPQIDSILIAFNQSLSTYIRDSEISKLNYTGQLDNPSKMFLEVLRRSEEIYKSTSGAFDPTVGPLVSAWGFGADKKPTIPDSAKIDSLMRSVGFDKIRMTEDIAMDSAMYLDFSAIAKGYAVDLIADFLSNKQLSNFMVEIGGEVITMGENDENEIWKIGIEDPMVDQDERRLLAIVRLKDQAMATSGNYRNYYQLGDRTIAHTIDPRTGYNTTHRLLSASVFARDCMTADAYATAFMVLGLDSAIQVVDQNELEAFLIYQDDSGELKSYVSEGLKKYVELNKL
ncbi:MAG: FAD:protein FMN transferase [Marinoscillum sp.]